MTSRSAVAQLIDLGELTAARLLAGRLGVSIPHGQVRILVADQVDGETALETVLTAWPDQDIFGVNLGREMWCIVAGVSDSADGADGADGADLPALRLAWRAVGDEARALLGPPVGLEHVASQRVRLREDLRWRAAQAVEQVEASDADRTARIDTAGAQAVLGPLLHPDRRELIEAVAGYLRHRGQWEPAARELGLHRNTLRYRIGRAEALLERDLRDPDVAAITWLALRALSLP